jgi:hypothetical protein
VTTTTYATEAPVAGTVDPGRLVRQEIETIRKLAQQAGDNPEALLQVLDRITQLHQATLDARQFIAEIGKPTVIQALQAGVDQRDLSGRPYADSQVRKFAREGGLPELPRGPRRRPLP